MSALTSLLARDHAVPVKKIEEAIQRQVISGGELATALLEVGAASENAICAYVAATYGLIPATRDDVMRAPREVVRLVPREVADKHRLVPLAVDGRILVVAVIAPLSREDEKQLGFLLGMTLVSRIATEPRIAAGLQHHFDVAMPSRLRRLVEKLRSQDAGVVPIVAPISENRVERGSVAPATTSTYARPKGAGSARQELEGDDVEGANNARVVAPGTSDAPSHAPLEAAEGQVQPAGATPERSGADADGGRVSAANVAPGVEKGAESVRAPRSALLAGHTGTLSADDAVRKLAEATSRDDVLHVAFTFLQQSFAFSALFLVHDDEADGIDVHGDGLDLEQIIRVTVRLDAPGTPKDVRDFLGARVSTLDATEADRALAEDLHRAEKQPSVVLPLVIRQRVVVLVYGDRGGKDFGLADLPDVLAFLPRVSEALQRLILQKKKGGSALPSNVAWSKPRESEGPTDVALAPSPARTEPESAAPPTVAFPTEASAAALGVDASKGSQRPLAFDLLGVPRAAPPPPEAPSDREPATSDEAVAAPTAEPIPAEHPVAEASDDDDDGPELIVEPEATPVPEVRRPVVSSTYHVTGMTEEVVLNPRRSVRPSAATPSRAPRAGSAAPPSSVAPEPRTQSRPIESEASIITSIGTSVDELVDELCATGPDDLEAPLQRLLEVGDAAIAVLARRFPGPLWFDRHLPHQSLPRGRDVSAVARALHAYRERAVPHLVPLVDSRDPDVRFYATLLAAELPHRELVVPVGRRLFESEAATRALALDVLRGFRKFGREMLDVLDAVRIVAGNERGDLERRLSAIRILGELRDDRSAELLVDLLGENVTGIPAQAHKSLVLITRQDFGVEPAKWEPWLRANHERHRVEWLIDGLLNADEELRRLAADELKQVTREFFGYHPSAPKKERELAHRKYRTWWEQHGQRRFMSGSGHGA